MKDLFGNEVTEQRPSLAQGYAKPPGSGPAGERCGTCAHAVAHHYNNKTYWKCGLLRNHWTRSYGSDIRLKSPACSLWVKTTKPK